MARAFLMESIDTQWKDHLLAMDHLREGVGLRGYGGQDPKRAYQTEGFEMFVDMNQRIRASAVEKLFKVIYEVPSEERYREIQSHLAAQEARRRQQEGQLRLQHPSSADGQAVGRTVVREGRKVGRNEPCPCGSGKKYKKCHGAAA